MIQTENQLQNPPVPLVYSGKVRDTYDLGDDRFLMVASDRISAFDVVLPSVVPGKGVVLTQLSNFWFERLTDIVPNHLAGQSIADLGWDEPLVESLSPRTMIVRKAERIPIECVVRGYLAGSAWVEYQRFGSVAGHDLPSGLQLSEKLPRPIFTPARKNDSGHDENITLAELRDEIGDDLASRLESLSLTIYNRAAILAGFSRVIIADTKLEFGFVGGELTLIDEALTPDSSRFWDASLWQPGTEAASFDKQFVRNWLLSSGWNREAPGPPLPADVVAGTTERYREAFSRITGYSLDEWLKRNEAGSAG